MKSLVRIILASVVGIILVVYVIIETDPQQTYTDSMEPTYMVGKTWSFHNPFEPPGVGDVILFDCLKESGCGVEATTAIVHRITSIDSSGCMTIVGDNPKYDWSILPCFMPDDIHIKGVSHIIWPLF